MDVNTTSRNWLVDRIAKKIESKYGNLFFRSFGEEDVPVDLRGVVKEILQEEHAAKKERLSLESCREEETMKRPKPFTVCNYCGKQFDYEDAIKLWNNGDPEDVLIFCGHECLIAYFQELEEKTLLEGGSFLSSGQVESKLEEIQTVLDRIDKLSS